MLNSIFFIFSAGFIFSAIPVFAETVPADTFLKSRIQQAENVSFGFIEDYFSRYDQFAYNCVPDSDLNGNVEWNEILTFQSYFENKPTGVVIFALQNNQYGFDLVFEKGDVEGELKDLYYIKESLVCGLVEAEGACSSFQTFISRTFKYSSYGVIDKNYADEASRSESWTFYFSNGELYAEKSISFEVRELNWIGAPSGRTSFSRYEVCHLIPHIAL